MTDLDRCLLLWTQYMQRRARLTKHTAKSVSRQQYQRTGRPWSSASSNIHQNCCTCFTATGETRHCTDTIPVHYATRYKADCDSFFAYEWQRLLGRCLFGSDQCCAALLLQPQVRCQASPERLQGCLSRCTGIGSCK